jgi:hypothetical protein
VGFHDDDDLSAGDHAEQHEEDASRKRAKGAQSWTGAAAAAATVPLQGGKGMQTLHASLGGATSLTSTGAVTVAPASAIVPADRTRSSRAASRAAIVSKPDAVNTSAAQAQASGSSNAGASALNIKRGRQQTHDKVSEVDAASAVEPSASDTASNPWLAPPSVASSGRERGKDSHRVSSSAVLNPLPASDFIREQSNEAASADIQEAFA